MKDKPIKNLAASIRQRLLNHARQHGDNFDRVLSRYAIERFLFRLSLTEGGERYVLKGAMLFATWPQHVFRPTSDLDLLGEGDPEPALLVALLTRICTMTAPEDGIVFDPDTVEVEPVREAERYQGARIGLWGHLGNTKSRVLIDVGFGDHVYPAPQRTKFPSLLPDLPQAQILMYPPETVIAEKFEAIIRFGEANSRVKDFYDIWVATRIFSFDLADLVAAMTGTLQRRETTLPSHIPVGLTEAFATIAQERGLWTGFLRRTSPTLAPPAFSQLQEQLRQFFGPVIVSLAQPEAMQGTWNPHAYAWENS